MESGCRVRGLGFGLWALGFGLWALGFGLWALGLGVWGLGFGVWGLGFISSKACKPPWHATKRPRMRSPLDARSTGCERRCCANDSWKVLEPKPPNSPNPI